jgi:CDP-diacylglycerol---serine O-phosphatidyltransferase
MIFRRHSTDERTTADIAAREDPYLVRQASRIYILPNMMTAGNLFCGFLAVINCIQARMAETTLFLTGESLGMTAADHYRRAVYFIFGAAGFDMLDGRLARLGGRESLFGAEFDSLADVISFGIAPALLMFFLILAPTQGFPWFRDIGWFVGFVYLLCAAMRLARFNVITNPYIRLNRKEATGDFMGLPVPAAALTVAALVLTLLRLAESDKSINRFAVVLPFLMLLIAFLMMSSVRYPSGKKVDMQTQTRFRTFFLLLALAALTVLYREVTFLCACLGYIFFGLIRHWKRRRRPVGQTV